MATGHLLFLGLRNDPRTGPGPETGRVIVGDLSPRLVRLELYAEPLHGDQPATVVMDLQGTVPRTVNGYRYTAVVLADRPANHYTPRIVPWHPEALVPLENSHLSWQH